MVMFSTSWLFSYILHLLYYTSNCPINCSAYLYTYYPASIYNCYPILPSFLPFVYYLYNGYASPLNPTAKTPAAMAIHLVDTISFQTTKPNIINLEQLLLTLWSSIA